jgi:hypothetical protein
MPTFKKEVQKFEGYIKTLELKFFKGKLHQKILAPHPEQTPAHAWVPIDSHDEEAPAPGEIPTADQEAAKKAAGTAEPATGEKTDAELTDEEKALAAANGQPIPEPDTGETGAGNPAPLEEPVRYSDSGPIPPAPSTQAPQPAQVAAAKAPTPAAAAKTAK